MQPIAIFRHLECEGPGFLQEVLDQAKLPTQLIRIDKNDPVPDSPDAFSGLVFMGGPMSVNDKLPWIEAELHLIRVAMDRNMPVLGHCLGGQLIAKALGGSVAANPEKEIGWFPVNVCRSPYARAWSPELPPHFEAFHWHGESFSIPAGATRLLESELCLNQGFTLGNCLALQCHVEMTAEMVSEWADTYEDELRQTGPGIQTKAEMESNLEQKISALQAIARILYKRWLSPIVEA